MTREHDRRTMLKATGATLAGASLAGCLAGGQVGSKGKQKSDDEVKADVTIAVGPGGNLTFAPENVTVHPGQTVAWEWKSDTHNVAVEGQPDDANWKGTAIETTTDGTPPATEDYLPIEVGPGGSLEFAPDLLEVPAGTEVTFVWKSNTHNVAVESQPKRANWDGSPGGDGVTYDAGYEYSYTFEMPGEYEYYCVPHEMVGMKGTIIVE